MRDYQALFANPAKKTELADYIAHMVEVRDYDFSLNFGLLECYNYCMCMWALMFMQFRQICMRCIYKGSVVTIAISSYVL